MGRIFASSGTLHTLSHTHNNNNNTQKIFLERPLIEAGTVTIWKGQRSCNGTSGHSYDIWEGRQSVQIHTHVRYAQVLSLVQPACLCVFVCEDTVLALK